MTCALQLLVFSCLPASNGDRVESTRKPASTTRGLAHGTRAQRMARGNEPSAPAAREYCRAPAARAVKGAGI